MTAEHVTNEVLAEALRFADAGIPVFPAQIVWDAEKRGWNKKPLTNHGHIDASTDQREVTAMFRKAKAAPGGTVAIGGDLSRAGLVAVDVDVKEGDGFAELADLEALHGEHVPDDVVTLTPSGGAHRILKMGAVPVGNLNGLPGAPNIDVKGEGGWVMLPGSVTPDGTAYTFEDGCDLLDGAVPGMAPKWLAQLVPARSAKVGSTGSSPGGWERVDREAQHPANIAALDALIDLGGHSAYAVGNEIHVVRPGKGSSNGASIGGIAPGIVKVWTSNWPGLNSTPPSEWYELDGNGQLVPRGSDLVWHPGIGIAAVEPVTDEEHSTSWALRDLGPALAGEIERTLPTILARNDGISLLYAGRINGLHADSGIGKSWIAALAAFEVIIRGGHVLWIDFEDASPDLIIERLRDLGLTDTQINEQFHYVNPDEPATRTAVDTLIEQLSGLGELFVVVDSVGESLGLHGADENADLDVDKWKRLLPHVLERAGHTVLLIDHATKAADNPLHPSGSKRKRAMISGASWLLEQIKPFDRSHPGKLRLTCAKDRQGNYRRAETGAWIHVDPTGDRLVFYIEAPNDTDSTPTQTGAVALIHPVIEAVRHAGANGLSLRSLRAAVRLRAKATNGVIDDAAALAEQLGCVRIDAGKQNAKVHRFIRDITDDDIQELTR